MELGLSTKAWTAIDCGDGPTWCAVSIKDSPRNHSKPRVLAAAEVPTRSIDAEAEALAELMGQVDRRFPAIVTLGRTQYRLRVMPEPAVPLREMHASLRWSLSTEAENALEEFNLAWMRIPTDEHLPSRPRQIYTVMTPTVWLSARVATWRQAGVKPKVVDIRETALRNIAGVLERPGEGLVLISQDSGGVGMVFTHQGSLYLDRYIEQPIAEFRTADAEARARLHERIALQLLRSVDVIGRSFPFMPVSRVLVAPAPEDTGLLEFLSSQLPLTVQALDLAEVFDLTGVPELAASPALQSRCLVALGATLRGARSGA
jgi:MSHA biogenesis protein MshI